MKRFLKSFLHDICLCPQCIIAYRLVAYIPMFSPKYNLMKMREKGCLEKSTWEDRLKMKVR